MQGVELRMRHPQARQAQCDYIWKACDKDATVRLRGSCRERRGTSRAHLALEQDACKRRSEKALELSSDGDSSCIAQVCKKEGTVSDCRKRVHERAKSGQMTTLMRRKGLLRRGRLGEPPKLTYSCLSFSRISSDTIGFSGSFSSLTILSPLLCCSFCSPSSARTTLGILALSPPTPRTDCFTTRPAPPFVWRNAMAYGNE